MEVRGRVNVVVAKSNLSLIRCVKMPSYASSVYILRCVNILISFSKLIVRIVQ